MTDSEIKLCANEKMAIDILDFIKRGYEKNYQDGGVKKYTEALQMGIDALTELNRQQAEIERLTEQLDGETVANMRLKHEIERLNLENLQMVASIKRLTNDFVNVNKMVKSEAIKEFAERLKATDTADLVGEQYINGEIYGYFYSNAFERKIDNLVKEMTEQRKEDEGK